MSSASEIFEFFSTFLKENYEINHLEMSTNFKKELGLTSFDFVNLICVIEEKYNVELEEERYRRISTIEELVEYVEEQIERE